MIMTIVIFGSIISSINSLFNEYNNATEYCKSIDMELSGIGASSNYICIDQNKVIHHIDDKILYKRSKE